MEQSTAPRISAKQAAYLREHESFHLTCVFLNCYGHDPGFERELLAFYEQHHATIAVAPLVWEIVRFQTAHDGTASLRAYADGLMHFSQRWRLDRFIGEPVELALHIYPDGNGYEALHGWCSRKARVPAYPVAQFGLHIHGGGGFAPQIGEVTHRNEIVLACPDGTTKTVMHEEREPIIRVSVVDYWQPLLDPPPVVKARMLEECTKQIDEAFERLMPMARDAGYVIGDTKTEIGKYASWAYRRFVKDEYFKDIARADFAADESVRLRTNEFAKAIRFSPHRTRRRDSA